ncbi:hypothetical protein NUM_29930 [Actinocatenispora comari]|uniref:Uncharacterized protein n=1 Tax=Actinocatenispora comari TaxID=2807577 RepID=A0A8J4AC92_9ACTN|nr:hypothetical protein NUM_29930 [Actinocatenispora comari]
MNSLSSSIRADSLRGADQVPLKSRGAVQPVLLLHLVGPELSVPVRRVGARAGPA